MSAGELRSWYKNSVIIGWYHQDFGIIILLVLSAHSGHQVQQLPVFIHEGLSHLGKGLIEIEVVIPAWGTCHYSQQQHTASAGGGIVNLWPWGAQAYNELLAESLPGLPWNNVATGVVLHKVDILP